ncbi:VanZ family protein [Actinoplanes sp. TFC3]|uniref:VanZ family protein n=1 Tax=Actinoplanes sp. TFC3 TaxID=1710355 RepID=UPI0008348EC1|nr:VanZ family protein [Actinoplanes sp. TFC3]
MRRSFLKATFLLYVLSVVAITVFPIQAHPPSYWAGEPFTEMIHWIPGVVDAPSFVLNVIMFVPFGVLLPLIARSTDSYRRIALSGLAASATIELVQFILGVTVGSRRTVDVNDLIANTAGALLGLLILRLAIPSARHRGHLRRENPAPHGGS